MCFRTKVIFESYFSTNIIYTVAYWSEITGNADGIGFVVAEISKNIRDMTIYDDFKTMW